RQSVGLLTTMSRGVEGLRGSRSPFLFAHFLPLLWQARQARGIVRALRCEASVLRTSWASVVHSVARATPIPSGEHERPRGRRKSAAPEQEGIAPCQRAFAACGLALSDSC